MLSAGSIYLDSGISISKGDRAFVFQDIEKPSPSIEYLVMNLPLEGGYRNTFSNGIAISLSLGAYFNVYEKIGTTTTDNRDFYPTSFSLKAMAGYGLKRRRRRGCGTRNKKHHNQRESNNKESLIPFHTVTLNFFEDIDYSLFTQF